MEAIVILSCHLWLQEEHMDPFFPDQEYMKVQETKVAQNESSLRSSFPVIYNSRRNSSWSHRGQERMTIISMMILNLIIYHLEQLLFSELSWIL